MQARAILSQLNVNPSKRRGQNFLLNDSIAESLVRRMNLSSDATVLEIGPGLGAITRFLVEAVQSLYVVDIEEEFCRHLRQHLPKLSAEKVLCRDICGLELVNDIPGTEQLIIVGNVPYSISTDIVLWLIKNRQQISRASLLMQREFAERLSAEPGGKEYGSLTVFCRVYADTSLGTVIQGSEFYPSAEVESQVIDFKFLPTPRLSVDEKLFERVVRASFSARRKTLLNCLLRGGLGVPVSREDITRALESVGINPTRRGETLTISEFEKVTGALKPLLCNPMPT